MDIGDPTTPVLAGSYATPSLAWDVAISGDYAYIADWAAGLQVIDISVPTVPVFAGGYDTPSYAFGIEISGDYACVADGLSGLQVIDISDPTTPYSVCTYDTPSSAWDVAISGDYAYVADTDSGLQVIEIYQRRFDTDSDMAWSLPVSSPSETIMGARLTSTQTDSIRWEISADSGVSWQEFLPGGDHQNFVVLGNNHVWRSTHSYTGSGINPACSYLQIEWLFDFPTVQSIEDIPNDQGKQVSLSWTRSGYDFGGSATPIIEYAVFRRIDSGPSEPVNQAGSAKPAANAQRVEGGPECSLLYPPGNWHFVKTVPAYCENSYSTVVPTLVDSTQSEGMQYSVFFVRAGTADPGVYFDAYPDSGYSVDNLAPSPPPNLRMPSATEVAWDECPDEDFNYFTVYGSADAALDSTATLIGYTISTTMDVAEDHHHYYHVTATDFSGNEGNASSVENQYAGVSMETGLPEFFALKPNRPNPFEASTVISFDLPKPCPVRVGVVDVQGRVVKVLTDEAWPAGRHSVIWTGKNAAGEETGPGVYFVRIQAGDFTARNKILRMK
jgi:hypothetical protein